MTSSEVPAKKYGERLVRFQMAVIVLFKSVLLLNDNMLLNYSQSERETLPLTDQTFVFLFRRGNLTSPERRRLSEMCV